MDRPYEHNAGTPCINYPRNEKGNLLPDENGNVYKDETHKIVKIYFDLDCLLPRDGPELNSRWSVDDINAKRYPWIRLHYNSLDARDSIINEEEIVWAGTPLSEFIKFVQEHNGSIYIKLDDQNCLKDRVEYRYRYLRLAPSC